MSSLHHRHFAAALVVLVGCGASDAAPDAARPLPTPDAVPATVDAAPAPPDSRPGTPDAPPPPDARPTPDAAPEPDAAAAHANKTVFLIVMENHNWSDIKGSSSAPYINNTLLAAGAHAEQYYNPPANHPSEPNYIWLEGGQTFGDGSDADPSSSHHITSTAHLAHLLNDAGISWRAYEEDITGTVCPLTAVAKYAPKHDPFVFFDDVTGGISATDPGCIAHNRPYSELAGDLASGHVARYNFLTPNLCDDTHDSCAPTNNPIKQGDLWLSQQVPVILASQAYQDGGVIIITWDEGVGVNNDGPIGLIVLSPHAKVGYTNTTTHYDHSSTLRTVQEIFGVTPLLGGAFTATDLSDLFTQFP